MTRSTAVSAGAGAGADVAVHASGAWDAVRELAVSRASRGAGVDGRATSTRDGAKKRSRSVKTVDPATIEARRRKEMLRSRARRATQSAEARERERLRSQRRRDARTPEMRAEIAMKKARIRLERKRSREEQGVDASSKSAQTPTKSNLGSEREAESNTE